jgi:hypothetical protein
VQLYFIRGESYEDKNIKSQAWSERMYLRSLSISNLKSFTFDIQKQGVTQILKVIK